MSVSKFSERIREFFVIKQEEKKTIDVNETPVVFPERPARGFFSSYLRTCTKECAEPLVCVISGKVPEWLRGTFLRNGPGAQQIGPDRYGHLFDGMALMHMFKIGNGSVTYQNRYLRSDSFKSNMRAQRIVVTEFGTRSHSDPCKTLLQRLMSYFTMDEIFSDNDLVGFYPIGDDLYAIADTPFIRRIDPDTLKTFERVDLRKYVAVNTATSHPHTDSEGNSFNMGSNVGTYNITCFPKKGGLQEGSIAASIPTTRPFSPGYFHSFCITENYFVFIEQPLIISIPTVLWEQYSCGTNSKILKWRPKYKTRFFLVNRTSGLVLKQKYYADSFAFFHTINAYEEDGHVVMDICCYPDGNMLKCLFADAVRKAAESSEECLLQAKSLSSRAERFVFPIITDTQRAEKTKVQTQINRLAQSEAKAFVRSDGSVYCIPENLTHRGAAVAEMPTINYALCNGKKYRYFYSITRREPDFLLGLMKCDTNSKSCLFWFEENCYPSEPIFVAKEEATGEDDGIILSSIVSEANECEGFLLVLDARTFTEVARASFTAPSAISAGFHGYFKK